MKSAKGKLRGFNNEGKGNFFVLLIIVVVAVIGLIFMLGGGFSKTVHSLFDSPENYFAYVEKKAFLGKKENPLRSAVHNVSSVASSSDRAFKEQITLTIGERGENYLSLLRAVGVDVTWLKSAGLEFVVNSKNKDLDLQTELTLNGKKIVSSDLILDSKNKDLYLKLPELSKKVARYDLDEYGERLEEALQQVEDLQKSYPEKQEIDQLVSKYVKVVLEGIDEVERERGVTLECDGITQKCTLLKATLDQDDLKRILSNLCKEAKNDGDIKDLFESYCLAMKMDSEDFDKYYEKLINSMENVDDLLDGVDYGFGKFTIELYVNGQGKVVGRVYSLYPTSGEKVSLKIATATKGRSVGFELSLRGGEENMEFSGTGKVRGGRLTGEYKLSVDGDKVMDISVSKFDLNSLNKGYLKGHFTCHFASDAGNLDLDEVLPRKTASLIQKYAGSFNSLDPGIDLDLDFSAKKHTVEIGLLLGQEDLLRLKAEGTMKSATKVKIPSKSVDVTDTIDGKDYLENLNWEKLLKALEDANVPDSYTNLIRKFMK